MATLRDIAEAAGVSVSTASRALKNSASISIDTRKLIQDIADKMKYTSKRTEETEEKKAPQNSVIAVILPHIMTPFFSTLLSGIQDAAAAQQFSVLLFCTEMDVASEKKAVEQILSMDIAGVIVAPPETEQTHCQSLHDAKLPMVYVGYRPSSVGQPEHAIVPDDFAGTKMAAEYLVSCGMKSIMLLTGPDQIHFARDRADGYMDVIKREKLVPNIYSGPFTYHAGFEMGLELFGQTGEPHADAVIAGADAQAIGILHALEKLGLKVPDDVSVISFDDTFLTGLSSPSLTAVSLPIYRMGTKSVCVLRELMEGKAIQEGIELVKPSLTKRKSCKE